MIYAVSSATIESSSRKEAMALARGLTKYVNENYPEQQWELLSSMTGREDRIAWVTKHESLAKGEQFGNRLAADKGFQEMMSKNIDAEEKRGRSFWVDAVSTDYWKIEEV